MRYQFAFLAFILSALAQDDGDTTPPEEPLSGTKCNPETDGCSSGAQEDAQSSNIEDPASTLPTVAYVTVSSSTTLYVPPEQTSTTNLGSTLTTVLYETTWSSASESTSDSSLVAVDTSTTTSPSESPSSEKSTSTETSTSTEASSTKESSTAKESSTSAAPKPTQYTPPENDKKEKEKVMQAAQDETQAGVFSVFSTGPDMHMALPGLGAEDLLEENYRWILLDDSAKNQTFGITVDHGGTGSTRGSTASSTQCSVTLHPARPKEYAYLQFVYSEPYFKWEDTACILEFTCDKGEKPQAHIDECRTQWDEEKAQALAEKNGQS